MTAVRLMKIKSDEERLNRLISIIKSIKLDTTDNNAINSPIYPMIVNGLYGTVFLTSFFLQSQDKQNNRSHLPPSNPENKIQPAISPKTSSDKFKEQSPYYLRTVQLIPYSQLRESVLAQYYLNTLNSQNINLGLDTILNQISNDKIKASLINRYNSYQSRTINQNSLKVNSDKETLLDQLKNKYKGYVLYIDIWGTWCGPCYESFKHAPKIKKSVENQKVVFIYLCSNCNKNKWVKDIKDFNLDGENIFLTSDQYMSLTKEFNIIGVPRYIIIDKNGKVVNANAPRPTSFDFLQKKLINELIKYSK
jgi:thiol-disulfide isomerase/thioredoxin